MLEEVVTGKAYRVLIEKDDGTKAWRRISFWGKAQDVEFNDGENLEDKMNGFYYPVNITIPANAWSSDPTLVSGRNYYTYTHQFTKVMTEHPRAVFYGENVVPTANEEADIGKVVYAVATMGLNTVTFYAVSVPTGAVRVALYEVR